MNSHTLRLAILSAIYLLLHLLGATRLPVFADEAIYIRWAQLIIDDWQQYLFFPLNDGKTPLLFWLMVPVQKFINDPLLAGRLISMLAGLATVLFMPKIVKKMGGDSRSQILAALFAAITPFWYFHHHLALIDGLLTLWISLTLLFTLQLATFKPAKALLTKKELSAIALVGLCYGLALWTKLPAVLAAPPILLFTFLPKKISNKKRIELGLKTATGFLLGGCFFFLLKLHPAFGQLFSRGSDFLYPVSTVLFEGAWRQTLIGSPNYILYFIYYLTPALLLLAVASAVWGPYQRQSRLLLLAGLLFIAPIALLGRVVYPRYLFPASLFFTISGALGFAAFFQHLTTEKLRAKSDWLKYGLVVFLLLSTLSSSVSFIQALTLAPDTTPFVSADREQYLTEWSSGHGIRETAEMLVRESRSRKIAVATEGYFGTLPDGLLMYLHNQDVSNIFVLGIGQPVGKIPLDFAVRARQFDEVWLVVNSHRLNMDINQQYLRNEYCRPYEAPCLQVWDITPLIKDVQVE